MSVLDWVQLRLKSTLQAPRGDVADSIREMEGTSTPHDITPTSVPSGIAELAAKIRHLSANSAAETLTPDDVATLVQLFQGSWPPHKALDHHSTERAWLMQGAAEALSRVVEAAEGTPGKAANTTTPFKWAMPDNNGPIIVACATLNAGGAERQAALTACGLADLGYSVYFVGFPQGQKLEEQYYAPMLAKHNVPILNAYDEVPLTTQLANAGRPAEAAELARRLNAMPMNTASLTDLYLAVFMRLRPRIVHAWLDYTNHIAGMAAMWAGVPRVMLGFRNVNPMNFPLYLPYFRPIYNILLSDSRIGLVANSRRGAVDYARWLHIDPDRVTIVRNAFEPNLHGLVQQSSAEHDVPVRSPDCEPLVLGVFRLNFEKDPLLFVRAAAEIAQKRPQARFVILGEGPMRQAVMEEAERLQIADRFSLPGRQSNVLAWMRSANVMLHTAHIEGLPNVMLEAQAAGLPVVSTPAGGSAEAIMPGLTGEIVNSRDPQTIAEAVLRVLSSEEWLERARQEGPASIRSRFGFASMINGTLRAYGHGNPSALDGA